MACFRETNRLFCCASRKTHFDVDLFVALLPVSCTQLGVRVNDRATEHRDRCAVALTKAILSNSVFLGVQIEWRVENLGIVTTNPFVGVHLAYAVPWLSQVLRRRHENEFYWAATGTH